MEKEMIERAQKFIRDLDERGFYFQDESQKKEFPRVYSDILNLINKPLCQELISSGEDLIAKIFPEVAPTNSPAENNKFARAWDGDDRVFQSGLHKLHKKGFDFDKIDGGLIIDLGCGTDNVLSYDMAHRWFPKSYLVGVDLDIKNLIARRLCLDANKDGSAESKLRCFYRGLGRTEPEHTKLDAYVHANAEKLPFPDQSAGIVLTNYLFVDNYKAEDLNTKNPGSWRSGIDKEKVRLEIMRILVPEGLYAIGHTSGLQIHQKKDNQFKHIEDVSCFEAN